MFYAHEHNNEIFISTNRLLPNTQSSVTGRWEYENGNTDSNQHTDDCEGSKQAKSKPRLPQLEHWKNNHISEKPSIQHDNIGRIWGISRQVLS